MFTREYIKSRCSLTLLKVNKMGTSPRMPTPGATGVFDRNRGLDQKEPDELTFGNLCIIIIYY
jgi:hypothetical protein